jgi:hypothetical protein
MRQIKADEMTKVPPLSLTLANEQSARRVFRLGQFDHLPQSAAFAIGDANRAAGALNDLPRSEATRGRRLCAVVPAVLRLCLLAAELAREDMTRRLLPPLSLVLETAAASNMLVPSSKA